MRLTIAQFLLLLGLAFPLLLNGQTFTNSLAGIACASVAVALALIPTRDRRAPRARLWTRRIIVGLGILLIAALLAQMPWAYRFQRGFNRQLERLRQRQITPGAVQVTTHA